MEKGRKDKRYCPECSTRMKNKGCIGGNMSEDKCSFCGADLFQQFKGCDKLCCESARYNSDGTFETFYSRSIKCYETEITNLKALAKKLSTILNKAHSTLAMAALAFHRPPDNEADERTDLLMSPEVQEIMKEGK